MMAKPMRKLITGLSSWGTLMSDSLLGTAVSEDVAEVVTLVELIQILREEVKDVKDVEFFITTWRKMLGSK